MALEVALITGANKGIGYETARQLGGHGFTVLVAAREEDRGRTAVESLTTEGVDARFVRLDVTDEDSVGRAAAFIDQEFGHLDLLVNNAGIPNVGGRRARPSVTSLDEMCAVYAVRSLLG